MKLAKEKDAERKEAIESGHEHQLPFLHGIPMSIKEQFSQVEMLSTIGCAMRNTRATENSNCIVPLLEAGAIPLVRGNLPQVAMSIHSTNLIWGTARNPYDQKRSCGGSSGGDAGLVAARCVPIALGCDIGSSIRIPAAFNGICGFKPTQGRLSWQGMNSSRMCNFDMTSEHFPAVPGPLCHSVRDCVEFFKI